MIIHQLYSTAGTAAPAIKVSSRTVSNTVTGGTCHSGVKFGLNGVLSTLQNNGGNSAVTGEWLVVGTASDFYVQRTIVSGTLQVDPGPGFLQLNVDRIYDNQQTSVGIKVTVVDFEVASDAEGTTIVATATMTFSSFIDVESPG